MAMVTLREFRELHKLVDQIFDESNRLDYTWEKLAEKAGLGYATVCRLGNYTTVYPRSQTVFLLAKAVGFKIKMEKAKLKLKITA